MLDETTPAFAHPVFKEFPHGLHRNIIFKIGVAFHNTNTMVDERVVDLHHQHAVQSLAAVFIPHTHQVEIGDFIFFHRAQKVDKAEWEYIAVTFLQRF